MGSGAPSDRRSWPEDLRVAVLLPCYNEAAAIAQTVRDFAAALPGATIYVFDNNSTDESAAIAASAGAIVRRVRQQGKGHVVRRMFADIEADIYVMADGDATYEAAAAPALIDAVLADNLDMVVAIRKSGVEDAYRRGHRAGNKLLNALLRELFGRSFTDILSGYRVLSRRFVKSFPVLSTGFEIETEMSVHALELRMPVGEIETAYAARPDGSVSKLSTYGDGLRILRMLIQLYRIERPLWFYGFLGGLVAVVAFILAVPVVRTYVDTGLVPRYPTVMAIVGLGIVAALSFTSGLILDTVTRGRQEVKRLAYLAQAAPFSGGERRRKPSG